MKNIYEVSFEKTQVLKKYVLADSIIEADKIAEDLDFSLVVEEDIKEFNSNKTRVLDNDEDINDFNLYLRNQSELLTINHSFNEYPDLCAMYDSSDPDHSKGGSDYFVDQLFEVLSDISFDSDNDKDIIAKRSLEIREQIKLVYQYTDIEIV